VDCPDRGWSGSPLPGYEKYGVEEYYIYDPDDGTLEGWLRKGDRLEEVTGMAGFVSPRLGVRFEPGEGPDNLRIVRPDGEPFQTHTVDINRRKAAEERAESERQRAERYAAKLRELGIEPD
jgi:hypothetical protein